MDLIGRLAKGIVLKRINAVSDRLVLYEWQGFVQHFFFKSVDTRTGGSYGCAETDILRYRPLSEPGKSNSSSRCSAYI